MDIVRTPAERFDGLEDFPYEARFHTWEGLRLARVDEGDGRPVLMLHGQPTWSFLFRKAVPSLVASGHRVIAPDLPGFGRSDKPTDVGWYSYTRHVAAIESLVEELDLRDVTVFLHDWGGPIGLRVATGRLADRFSGFVAMNTMVLTGDYDMGDPWRMFRDLVAARPDIEVGRLIRMTARTRDRERRRAIVAGYDAPFPDVAYKAGVQAFPTLIPLRPEDPGASFGRDILAALRDDDRPALLLWAEHDPLFPWDPWVQRLQDAFPRADAPLLLDGVSHFGFEDDAERIAHLVAEFTTSREASVHGTA